MARHDPAPLRELRDWLSQSVADAQAILPDLLDLPLPALHLKLSVRPQLRTAGMMQCLLDLAEKALGRFRHRAYELTSIAVEIVDELLLAPHERLIAHRLRAQAWKTHARALRGLGRPEAALEAISVARRVLAGDGGNEWFLATVDAIEARILHALGRGEEALPLARRAARVLLAYDDHEEFVKATVAEASILNDLGRPWLVPSADESLVARLKYHRGVFALRHGSAETAWQTLSSVCDELRALGLTAEAIGAHRAMAEAATRLGRPHDAISERYKAFAELLRGGDLDEAAAEAAQIVAQLLPAGRTHEAESFAAGLPGAFESLGLRASALEALVWLRARAEAGRLGVEDAVAVRCYFHDLFVRPNARFEIPGGAPGARRIERLAEFEAALVPLGIDAYFLVNMIEQELAAAPERNPVVRGDVRMVRARGYARYPALRIFYKYDAGTVYLLSVEPGDELLD
jgi:tetratricopeptide (TPR) repeat protein